MRTTHTIIVYATGHNLVTGRAKEKIFPFSIVEETWNGKKTYYGSYEDILYHHHFPCPCTLAGAFNEVCRSSKLEQLAMKM